jgi:hypothetical protein
MGVLPINHALAHDNLAALEIIYSAYKDGIKENNKFGRLPLHLAANYDALNAIKLKKELLLWDWQLLNLWYY